MVDTEGLDVKGDDLPKRASAISCAVGKRIRSVREGLGMSQEALAEKMGAQGRKEVAARQKKLSRLESGTTEIKLVDLDAIATALDVPHAALVPGYVEGDLTAEEAGLLEAYRLDGAGGLLAFLAPRVRESR